MTDGSVLPQAEGKGGIVHVIHDCKANHTSTPAHTSKSSPACSEIEGTTLDFELVDLSPTEFPVLSVEHNMDLEDLAPGFEAHYGSFDSKEMSPTMYSSTYDYTMNNIDEFMSNAFIPVNPCHDKD